jgi:hypothetical protein
MTYNEDEDEGFAGDPQESDGVNHGDEMGPSGSDAHRKVGDDDIAAEIDRFLKTPRFNGDICVTLSMPDTYLKKARDKLNLALWNAHRKYARMCKRRDADGNEYDVPGFGMFDILLTLSPYVDPVKLSAILDNDIKQKVAEERGIKISDEELEYVASHPLKDGDSCGGEQSGDIVECPECHGTGEVDGEECSLCLGQGKVRRVVEDVPQTENDLDQMDLDINAINELMGALENGKV